MSMGDKRPWIRPWKIVVDVFFPTIVTVFTSILVEVPGNRAYEKEKN